MRHEKPPLHTNPTHIITSLQKIFSMKAFDSTPDTMDPSPSSPLQCFMNDLLNHNRITTVRVKDDNHRLPLTRSTRVSHNTLTNHRSHRSCRWNNASPASLPDSTRVSPTSDNSKLRLRNQKDISSSPQSTKNPSPTRWDLHWNTNSAITSPMPPCREKAVTSPIRPSRKQELSRYAMIGDSKTDRLSNRSHLPTTLRNLPY